MDSTQIINCIRLVRNPHMMFLDSLKLIRSNYILHLKNGCSIILRPKSTRVSDVDILKEILLDGQYDCVQDKIGESDTIVDIGAQIGIFSVLCAKKVKNGRVFAFEPAKNNFALLKENITLNKLTNVIASNLAVAKSPEDRDFFINKHNNGGHSFYKSGNCEQTRVKCTTLDEIFLRDCNELDLLKLDCEGAEYQILYSVNKSNLRKIKRIIMEVHMTPETAEYNPHHLISFLRDNGFKVTIVKRVSYADEGKFMTIHCLNNRLLKHDPHI